MKQQARPVSKEGNTAWEPALRHRQHSMKILIVCTSESAGGAAVAAKRLAKALDKVGHQAKMLVRDACGGDKDVAALPRSPRHKWNFLWERWCVFLRVGFSKAAVFLVDIANAGTDITRLPEFRQADIVHLHWINQGMLSIGGIRKILQSGKPVVWTMHDMWPHTAICHYAHGCRKYETGCEHCPQLPARAPGDMAREVWERKKRMLKAGRIHFVACSRWLAGTARNSRLLEGMPVTAIPNPIDTAVYKPAGKAAARRRFGLPQGAKVLMFASQRVTIEIKGMAYFAEACRILAGKGRKDICVAVLGGSAEDTAGLLALPSHPIGYISDPAEMAEAYSAADVFVLPSLAENLPNTIMEAMACGTPCTAFGVGGVPEMVAHKVDGYVAEPRNAQDLANGIEWVLEHSEEQQLPRKAAEKVAREYSEKKVAEAYTKVYESCTGTKGK